MQPHLDAPASCHHMASSFLPAGQGFLAPNPGLANWRAPRQLELKLGNGKRLKRPLKKAQRSLVFICFDCSRIAHTSLIAICG